MCCQMNLKEQLAQTRSCGLEILTNVFLKAVFHSADHPETRGKKKDIHSKRASIESICMLLKPSLKSSTNLP